ncbi:MAG: hypothetical protein OEY70_16710 [Acidimicrobiia bacterium]|nr:hypothetical protein [Acidimicrobiia bacterium]
MSNLSFVTQINARCNPRVPAMSTMMPDTRAPKTAAVYERIEATWLHTPKFGPDHHSQRWRPAS